MASAAAPGIAQDWSRKVTFSAPASRASVLLPLLSKVTGFDLQATAKTENDVLQVQVTGVTTKDLLERLAKAANAEWKVKGKTLLLTRSDLAIRKAEDKLFTNRLAAVQAFLDKDAADLKTAPGWTDASAAALAQAVKDTQVPMDPSQMDAKAIRAQQQAARKLATQLPVYSTVHNLVQAIGAKPLTPLLYGQRLVFALHPNSMQLPMSEGAQDILRQFVATQKQYADAYKQLTADSNPNGPRIRRFGGSGDLGGPPEMGSGDPSLGVGQAILTLYRGAQPPGNTFSAQVTLTVTDTKGVPFASGNTSLNGVFQFSRDAEGAGDKVALSPLALELASGASEPYRMQFSGDRPTMFSSVPGLSAPIAFMSKGQDQDTRHVSEELRKELLQPETIDPLAIVLGEALNKSATALHANLVAELPDTAFQSASEFFGATKGQINPAEFVDKELASLGMTVQRDGDWISITPTFEAEAVERRTDRVALGHFLRTVEKNGSFRLDDLATLAASRDKAPSPYDIDLIYLHLASPSLGSEVFASLQAPNPLRIYSQLSPSEKALAASNGSIPLTDLNPKQRAWLYDEVFNSFTGFRSERIPGFPSLAMPPSGGVMRRGSNQPVLADERTVTLPNGIPPTGRLSFSLTSDSGVVGITPNNTRGLFLTSTDLAARLFQRDKPQFGTPTEYASYFPAARNRILMRFTFTDTCVTEYSLEDLVFGPSAKAVAYQDLPSDLQKTVQDMLEKIRQSPIANMQINRGGFSVRGKTPPP